MNRNRYIILAVFAVLLCGSRSYAEPTVENWIKSKNEWVLYVVGVGTGISWANSYLGPTHTLGQKPIYCQPGKLILEVQNDVKILDTEIQKNPNVKLDTPLGMALLLGYRTTFPCPGENN